MLINTVKIKKALGAIAILALLTLSSFMAPLEAHAKGPSPTVPVIGKTADGKYPVYQLDGDLGDFTYFSGNTAWKPKDLINRMQYIDPKDVNNGKYKCDWICKDGFQNTVGLDPSIKKIPK